MPTWADIIPDKRLSGLRCMIVLAYQVVEQVMTKGFHRCCKANTQEALLCRRATLTSLTDGNYPSPDPRHAMQAPDSLLPFTIRVLWMYAVFCQIAPCRVATRKGNPMRKLPRPNALPHLTSHSYPSSPSLPLFVSDPSRGPVQSRTAQPCNENSLIGRARRKK